MNCLNYQKNVVLCLCLLLCFTLVSCDNIKTTWLSVTANGALDKDNMDKAITQYQKLIEMHPDEYSYYWNLGVAYYRKGDSVNAKKLIKKLRALGKDDLADELEDQVKEIVKNK